MAYWSKAVAKTNRGRLRESQRLLQDMEARVSRHLNVLEYGFGLQVVDFFQGLGGGSGRAHDVHSADVGQEKGQLVQGGHFVIDEEAADGFGVFHVPFVPRRDSGRNLQGRRFRRFVASAGDETAHGDRAQRDPVVEEGDLLPVGHGAEDI